MDDPSRELEHAAELAAISVNYLKTELKLRDDEVRRYRKLLEKARIENTALREEIQSQKFHPDPASVGNGEVRSFSAAPSASATKVVQEEAVKVETVSSAVSVPDVDPADELPPLIGAALRGEIDSIPSLIAHGANVHARCADGQSAMHIAAAGGFANIVCALCDASADVNSADDGGWTPLHVAANGRHSSDIVGVLLRRGAHADAVTLTDSFTALHIAAAAGHASSVALLLRAGAEVAATDANGWTALAHAAVYGDAATVALLIGAHADVYCASAQADAPHTPILHLAALCGNVDAVELLLSAGSNAAHVRAYVRPQLFTPRAWFHCFVMMGAQSHVGVCCSGDLRTPLHQAACCGLSALVPLLVKAGAEVDATDASGRTALHVAADEGFSKYAAALLALGADGLKTDSRGLAPIHYAASTGSLGAWLGFCAFWMFV